MLDAYNIKIYTYIHITELKLFLKLIGDLDGLLSVFCFSCWNFAGDLKYT